MEGLILLIHLWERNERMKNTGRTKEKFDFGWMFHKGDIPIKHAVKAGMYSGLTNNAERNKGEWLEIAFSDTIQKMGLDEKKWKKVNLPHDWCVEGNFIHDDTLGSRPGSHGYLPAGIGCYRKEFTIPAEDLGKRISLEFDGAMRNTTVWVNGHLLGNHRSGYTPFSYDITDKLRYGAEGNNVIFARVDACDPEGWWYEGCGFYRHVWLVKTEALHVAQYGTYVTTPLITEKESIVTVKTRIRNQDRIRRNCELVTKILNEDGVEIESQSTNLRVPELGEIEQEQALTVPNPRMWSPEEPYLYKVFTEIREDSGVADTYETIFGIRSLEFTSREGFFLNGKHYPIKGTCNHQDFAGVGVALPDKINAYKIKLLKEMGCNAYRCSHHPPTPELLDICDRIGMLVMDENRLLDSSPTGIEDLKTLLYRDRNHPCIILWSMENEEILEGTVMGARILESLVQITKKIDPTRPTVVCMNHGWNEGGYCDVADITGYNYGQRRDQYILDHKNYPERKMLCTESTSCTTTRGVYENDTGKGYCSTYETLLPSWSCSHEKSWQDVVAYPYLGGIFVWTGFDYRGETTPYLWPCVTSHFGIMDICGFPKDGYYFYKSAWTKEPMVHIFPHWNWTGRTGQVLDVWCYSNCDEVELFLNDRSLGKKNVVPNTRLVWNVAYASGKLEAVGKKNGQTAAVQVLETTGKADKIDMMPDCDKIRADGCDVTVVRVAIQDDRGRVVPTADNLVRFSIEGPGAILGVGNGDPSSHEPDKASMRRAFNGWCLVLVQSIGKEGAIRLKAGSTGLASKTIEISACV